MADMSGFLSALGMMFKGIAQGRKDEFARQMEQQREAREQNFQHALMGEYADRGAYYRARAAQDASLNSPEFQATYQSALNGDQGAISKVASMVGGHPDASAIIAPLLRPDKPNRLVYDSERGVLVDPTTGETQVLHGLPPRAGATPTDNGPTPQKRALYILRRAAQLTQPQKAPGLMGATKIVPGLSRPEAEQRAGEEYDNVYGTSTGAVSAPFSPSSTPPTARAPQTNRATDPGGDINLGGGDPTSEFATLAGKYRRALGTPGIDPEAARQAYNSDVRALATKYTPRNQYNPQNPQ